LRSGGHYAPRVDACFLRRTISMGRFM